MDNKDSLQLKYIRKISPNPNWHNRESVHSYHELIIVLSGIMHVSGVNQVFELHPGDAALYPAGVKHVEYADANEPVDECFIAFEDDNLSGDSILVNKEQGVLLRAMASALHEYFIEGENLPFGNDYLKLMLQIFFTKNSTSKKNTNFVHKVNAFIQENMATNIDLFLLSKVAGLSKYHFLHQYQMECGITPIKALWEMRCKEAITLLNYTQLPLKEIAQRTGFSDMKHFSRKIKAFCGKSPSEFRTKQK
jgi:AraC-like DNA-binding protein